MITELIRAFLLIFAAEMGDKTQIIAMTFATQYTVKEVLSGVVLGVVANHGIAIILGQFISNLIPMDLIQIVAGLMFVMFGIMALKDDNDEEENQKKSFGPIFTVALAFFVGELGDKTQLTAMTLSTEANYPLFILIGTTLGMVATSSFGIFIGSKIGDKIPEVAIKISSSIVFIFFGSLKLLNTLPKAYLSFTNIAIYLILIVIVEYVLIEKLLQNKRHKTSPMVEAATKLYNQTQNIKDTLDKLCLGENKCGKCMANNCLLGYTRHILNKAREDGDYYKEIPTNLYNLIKKQYDKNKVTEALALLLVDYLDNQWRVENNFVVNKVRESLELILFEENISFSGNVKKYVMIAKVKNKKFGDLLEKNIKKLSN